MLNFDALRKGEMTVSISPLYRRQPGEGVEHRHAAAGAGQRIGERRLAGAEPGAVRLQSCETLTSRPSAVADTISDDPP